MSIQAVTEDHRIQAMKYGTGTFDLNTHTGTHLYVIVRLDATFSEAEVKEIQDKMSINAKSNNPFTAIPVNEESFTAVENALKAKMPEVIKRDPSDTSSEEVVSTTSSDGSSPVFCSTGSGVGSSKGSVSSSSHP